MKTFTVKNPVVANTEMKAYLKAQGCDEEALEHVVSVNNVFFADTTQGKTYEVLKETSLPIPLSRDGDYTTLESVHYIDDHGNLDATPLILINLGEDA